MTLKVLKDMHAKCGEANGSKGRAMTSNNKVKQNFNIGVDTKTDTDTDSNADTHANVDADVDANASPLC